MYPCIEIAQHACIDCGKEIEEIFREVEVTHLAFFLILIPVDKVFGHPNFLAFLSKVFICRLYATILVSTINVETINNTTFVQGIDVGVTHCQCLWSHNLATDCSSVCFHKLCNLTIRPQASCIFSRPVRLILNADGIQLHPIFAHILYILLQILSIICPIGFFQLTCSAITVFRINRAIRLPFRRLPPRRCKHDESHLLCFFGGCQRLTPRIFANRDIKTHDITPHSTVLSPHLLNLRV